MKRERITLVGKEKENHDKKSAIQEEEVAKTEAENKGEKTWKKPKKRMKNGKETMRMMTGFLGGKKPYKVK